MSEFSTCIVCGRPNDGNHRCPPQVEAGVNGAANRETSARPPALNTRLRDGFAAVNGAFDDGKEPWDRTPHRDANLTAAQQGVPPAPPIEPAERPGNVILARVVMLPGKAKKRGTP